MHAAIQSSVPAPKCMVKSAPIACIQASQGYLQIELYTATGDCTGVQRWVAPECE